METEPGEARDAGLPPEKPHPVHDEKTYNLLESRLPPSKSSKQPAARKTGRPKKNEKDLATKVTAALGAHHKYKTDGSVTNYEPATNRDLAEKYGLSENALSRFLTDKLGKDGHKQYAAACRGKKIDTFLALWNRELPGRLAKLMPQESGREEGRENNY